MAKNDFSAESAENFEQKCLCVLVLDVSGSMRGEPINELNKGLQEFYREVSEDETTSQRLEVSIMTFKESVKTLQEPALVDNFTMPTLSAYGSTAMCDGVNEAIDKVEARKKWYKETGQKYYRPVIILMTDGEPDDGQDVYGLAARIKNGIESKKFAFFSVGIEGANMQTLQTLQNGKAPVKLNGLKFKSFFQWLSASFGDTVKPPTSEPVDFDGVFSDIDWGAYEIGVD